MKKRTIADLSLIKLSSWAVGGGVSLVLATSSIFYIFTDRHNDYRYEQAKPAEESHRELQLSIERVASESKAEDAALWKAIDKTKDEENDLIREIAVINERLIGLQKKAEDTGNDVKMLLMRRSIQTEKATP